jgi:hypothetical protein
MENLNEKQELSLKKVDNLLTSYENYIKELIHNLDEVIMSKKKK